MFSPVGGVKEKPAGGLPEVKVEPPVQSFQPRKEISMGPILLIVILVIVFGGGGGYYGYRTWGPTGGIGIVGVVLIIAVLWYLFSGSRRGGD